MNGFPRLTLTVSRFFAIPIALCAVFLHAGYDPSQSKVIFTSRGTLALIDLLDASAPIFEVEADAAPLVYWALANAISLDTTLNVQNIDGHNVLVAGRHGATGRFLIDARYVSKERSRDGLKLEYFFEKDGHRFKIFSHDQREDSDFLAIFVKAAIAGGFICLTANDPHLAVWARGRPIGQDEWDFVGHDKTRVGYMPFSDLVQLEPSRLSKKIAFKRLKKDRQDSSNNIYKATDSGLQVSGFQKAYIRGLEQEIRYLGGGIFCAQSVSPLGEGNKPFLRDVCFRVGPNFSIHWTRNLPARRYDDYKYNEADVRKVLWLSVKTSLPESTFSPLFLADGALVLPAIGGKTNEEVILKIGFIFESFSRFIMRTSRFALPINFCGHWVAIIVNRGQDRTKLTYLDSLATWDKFAFSTIEYAIKNALENERLSSPRVTTHHIQPDNDQDSDGIIMIENLLRHLGFGGPALPLVLMARDVQEVREGHNDLLRLHGEKIGYILSSEDDSMDSFRAQDISPPALSFFSSINPFGF